MAVTKPTMDNIAYFEYWIDGETFEKLYVKYGRSKHLANHVWGKFHGYDHSVLRLWAALDSKNQRVLIKVIKDFIKRRKRPF